MTNYTENNAQKKNMIERIAELLKPHANHQINTNMKTSLDSSLPPENQAEIPNTTKVKLSDYGFEQAGINRGDPTALENNLFEIKEGHIVDITYSETEHLKRKSLIEDQIAERNGKKIELEQQEKNIREVLIPEKEQKIGELKSEIKKTKEDARNGTLISGYNRTKHLLYIIILWLTGIYLIFFYASAIHSAFFRNIIHDLKNFGTSDNLSMMLNSIFDPMALFRLQASTLMIYLASSLFFAMGLLAHIYLHRKMKLIYKIPVFFLAIFIPLAADFLLARKIHQNIVIAETLIGFKETNLWYESFNFWLVIIFGYVAYMVWAFLFNESIAEGEKRNGEKAAEKIIIGLNEEIKAVKNEINNHKLELNNIIYNILQLDQEIGLLKKQIEKLLQDPDLLLRNLHNFFDGWLRYLNAAEHLNDRKAACIKVFEQFIDNQFVKTKIY